MSKWICRRCPAPCKADFCTETTIKPKICPFFSLYNANWQPDVPAVEPEPEPEKMYMLDALEKAKAEGGEVWYKGCSTWRKCTVKKGGYPVWDVDKEEGFVDATIWHRKDYTVRPLAPALLPCPFCGGEAAIRNVCGDYFVSCELCKSSGTIGASVVIAIAAWNRREGSGS